MRVLKILLLASLISYILLSCSKNNQLLPTTSKADAQVVNGTFPAGIWEGEYTRTSRDNPGFLCFDIRDNGSLYALDETHEVIGVGSWQLSDSVFNAYYMVNATQEANFITGHAANNPDKLFGKWTFDNDYMDAGKWQLERLQYYQQRIFLLNTLLRRVYSAGRKRLFFNN